MIDRDDLIGYVRGELSPERRAEVESELQRDPSLRAELERYRAVRSSLHLASGSTAPHGLSQTLSALNRPSPWWGSRQLLAGAAATVAVAVFATSAVLVNRQQSHGAVYTNAPAAKAVRATKVASSVEGPQGAPRAGDSLVAEVSAMTKVSDLIAKLGGSIRSKDGLAWRVQVPADKLEQFYAELEPSEEVKRKESDDRERLNAPQTDGPVSLIVIFSEEGRVESIDAPQ